MKIIISIAWGVIWFVLALIEQIKVGANNFGQMNQFGKIATIMAVSPIAYWVVLFFIMVFNKIFKK